MRLDMTATRSRIRSRSKDERRKHDADHRAGAAAQRHRSTDNSGIAAELRQQCPAGSGVQAG
jgi:hypothetical protein